MSDSASKTVSVHGLGYVGCVSAACLASMGFRVIGVDVSEDKVALLGAGKSPVVEEKIGELIAEVVDAGMLTVTSDTREAVRQSDISLICVGTPSGPGGGLSTQYLEAVSAEVGAALADKTGRHTVVFRSTMLPGTCEDLLIPLLEKSSGKKAGTDFGVCVNPEYLREGTSVRDFLNPPKTVVGSSDTRAAEEALSLYSALPGDRFHVGIRIAEMTKFVENSFHALKVCFANEVGSVCAALGIDSHDVMDILVADTKLNVGPAYLRPGFAFGGSCLPKDVRALNYAARSNNVDTPILANVLSSNGSHLLRALDLIVADGRRNVGICGLSFKPGTDDLRESPMVELAERLMGKGFNIKIHDANVALSRIVGANRAYINERLPHIGELLVGDVQTVVDHAEILVVASQTPEVLQAVAHLGPDCLLVDLVRLPDSDRSVRDGHYRGIAW